MVAMQIAQLTPLMREGILLCYAKIPGDPETLKGDKQRMAHKIYNILSDSSMVYKFHTAAIITKEISMPMYDAAWLNHHTNFGGSGGAHRHLPPCSWLGSAGGLLFEAPMAGRVIFWIVVRAACRPSGAGKVAVERIEGVAGLLMYARAFFSLVWSLSK